MKITEILPIDPSGYCDVATGECVTPETERFHSAQAARTSSPAADRSPARAGHVAVGADPGDHDAAAAVTDENGRLR